MRNVWSPPLRLHQQYVLDTLPTIVVSLLIQVPRLGPLMGKVLRKELLGLKETW